MAIVQTLDKYQFEQAFKAIRPDNFSYQGLSVLFDYFEEASEAMSEPFELDVIAICCDWCESDWKTIAQDYRIDLSDVDTSEGDEEAIQTVYEYLSDNTQVLELSDGVFVYAAF